MDAMPNYPSNPAMCGLEQGLQHPQCATHCPLSNFPLFSRTAPRPGFLFTAVLLVQWIVKAGIFEVPCSILLFVIARGCWISSIHSKDTVFSSIYMTMPPWHCHKGSYIRDCRRTATRMLWDCHGSMYCHGITMAPHGTL